MDDYLKIVQWLKTEAAAVAYGEITITITKHDNQIRFIEKTIKEKEKFSST